MLNRIVVQGRLTKDPVARAMPNGKSTVGFAVACERDYRREDGGRTTDFIDCVAFDSTADFLCRYFTKGKMVLVEGRLQQREFTGKDGEKKHVHEIYAEKIHFCDTKKDDGGSGVSRKEEQQNLDDMRNIDPDDIPF